ncbi:hypothetical protein T4B_11218 [Trichinella pseudospiralis]|uniref:Uncharacterized protein n=1 Tax=Trichinella pseudospiralis TaxID=6337 RepID=A0A0V1IND2_TRIPS|nr:hypothetical protein T4B_11218 [Trichinella pseudospiralis]
MNTRQPSRWAVSLDRLPAEEMNTNIQQREKIVVRKRNTAYLMYKEVRRCFIGRFVVVQQAVPDNTEFG